MTKKQEPIVLVHKKDINKALPHSLSITDDVIMQPEETHPFGEEGWSVVFLDDSGKTNRKQDNIELLRDILEEKTGKPWRIDPVSNYIIHLELSGCKRGYAKNPKTKKCVKLTKNSQLRYHPASLRGKDMLCVNDNITDTCINFLEYPTITALDTQKMVKDYIQLHKDTLKTKKPPKPY